MAVPLFACGSLCVRIVVSATEVPLLDATGESFCVLAQLVDLKFSGGSHIPDSSEIQHLTGGMMNKCLVRSNLFPAAVTRTTSAYACRQHDTIFERT